jgi:signal transduction histidine kinase
VSLLVFGLSDVLDPSRSLHAMVLLLVVALATGVAALVAVRRFPLVTVTRAALATDIVLIGAMTVALDEPSILTVAYYAPIAFAALVLGPLDTLAYTALACVATVVAAPLVGDVTGVTELADLLVLAITGAILAALSHEMRAAQRRLAVERDVQKEAVDLLEEVRATLDTDEILERTVAALGRMTQAARVILRSVDPGDRVYAWHRADLEQLPSRPGAGLPAPAARVVETRKPLLVRSREEVRNEPELLASMERSGAQALIVYPIWIGGEVEAVLGVHDDQARPWTGAAAALVERIAPQVGAALAQARAFEELREVNRMREELIANVSHELRTPLTSTIGFLRTVERDDIELTPERQREFLALARREAERLAFLVSDLLQLATAERGQLRIDPRPLDLAALTREAVMQVDVPLDRSIDVRVDGELDVVVDSERMMQLLLNLLQNALHHGAGEVRVAGGREGGTVRLEISDEGRGVPLEHLPELFVPFARWSEHPESTGLGLAIAQRIARAHGGSLDYRPAKNGDPHAFVLELPTADA